MPKWQLEWSQELLLLNPPSPALLRMLGTNHSIQIKEKCAAHYINNKLKQKRSTTIKQQQKKNVHWESTSESNYGNLEW